MVLVLLLTLPDTADDDDDVSGKQLDWLTSTAASLFSAQQHSAEYDSMVKSIGLATGAASVAPCQQVHPPSKVVQQPKKDAHAQGKLVYDNVAKQRNACTALLSMSAVRQATACQSVYAEAALSVDCEYLAVRLPLRLPQALRACVRVYLRACVCIYPNVQQVVDSQLLSCAGTLEYEKLCNLNSRP